MTITLRYKISMYNFGVHGFNVINIDFITRRKEWITRAKGQPYGRIIDPAKSVDLLARVYPSIVGNLDRNQFAVAGKSTGQALPGFRSPGQGRLLSKVIFC